MRTVVAVLLIAVGGLVLAYLAWFTATAEAFFIFVVMLLIGAVVASVFVVAVLAILGVLAWWIALLVVTLAPAALLVGLSYAAALGFSRLKTKLKRDFPGHWHEGEASGRTAAERIAVSARSFDEANQMREELRGMAEDAHVKQHHGDCKDHCLEVTGAFDDAMLES